MTPGPISPAEAESGDHIPEEVFAAFNELIREHRGRVMQDDVVARIMAKMPDVQRADIFAKGWLNVAGAYRKKGWRVDYDKPGFNETYAASFEFTKR